MADDKSKKPKINLKDRLGKTNIGTGSVPLPVPGSQPSSPGAPQGIAPPPGITPGIPVPPFAGAKPAAAEPAAPKPTVVQQTIKVEVGEEIIKEREKAKKRTYIVGAVTALLGLAIGFPIGGQSEKSTRGKAVVENARGLLTDVKAANDKMKELDTLLSDAAEKLGKKEYPTELAGQLGGINIPFDASKVEGPRIAGLKASALRSLLKYTSGVDDLNKKKDSLKNLLEAVKAPVEKSWKEEKEPVVGFSVVFRAEGQKGVMAELVQTKAPFEMGKDWPASYEILKPERTQQGMKNTEKKGNRYTKGDLPGTGDPIVIPVDPSTTAVFTSQEIVFRLRKAFIDMRETLKGNHDVPGQDIDGLIEIGDVLYTDVQKITTGG